MVRLLPWGVYNNGNHTYAIKPTFPISPVILQCGDNARYSSIFFIKIVVGDTCSVVCDGYVVDITFYSDYVKVSGAVGAYGGVRYIDAVV